MKNRYKVQIKQKWNLQNVKKVIIIGRFLYPLIFISLEDSNLKKKRKAKDITIGYDEISTPPESINELPLKKSRIQQEFFEFEQGQSIESFQDDFSEKKHG